MTPIGKPDFLDTESFVPWSWGNGNDVWEMFSASMQGDIDRLTTLLRNQLSLVRCEASYRNPLHFAVLENQVESVKLLLQHGSDITYTGERWHDSVGQVCKDRGYVAAAKTLNDHQLENWNICAAGDEFAEACRDRDIAKAKNLLAQHGHSIADARGNRPIHWAVMIRHIELIDHLLDRGADLNAQRPDGARPLDLTNGDYWYRGWRDIHPEAPSDHWVVMEHLLSQGAHYDLTTACRRNDMDRVRAILLSDPEAATKGAEYSCWYSGYPLRSAAKGGFLELVELLLEQGADPNMPEHGLAPFGGAVYDATQNGHYEVVECLLRNGASPNQEVESSGSPLSAAKDERMKKLLLNHGAMMAPFGCCYYGNALDFGKLCSLDPQTANCSWLFTMAASKGHRDVVEVFEKFQPEIWTRCPAALGEDSETTQWMFDCGMQVNNTNWLGVHPLHKSFTEAELSVWMERNVDLNLLDGEHRSTPLGWAAKRGDLRAVDLLLSAGAERDLAGAEWAKPIEWAKRRGHMEVVKRLEA